MAIRTKRHRNRKKIDFDALHAISAAHMAAFDAMGPKTRQVIANAPEQLDAHELAEQLRMSIDEIRLHDVYIASGLKQMLIENYGENIGCGY